MSDYHIAPNTATRAYREFMALSEQHDQQAKDWKQRAFDILHRWAAQEAATAGVTVQSEWIRKNFTIDQASDPFAQVTITSISGYMQKHDDAPSAPAITINWCPTQYVHNIDFYEFLVQGTLEALTEEYRPLIRSTP